MRKSLLLVAVLAALATIGAIANAYASSNKQVFGSGTGSITCTSGGTPLPATISFSANFSKGTVSGSFTISGAGVTKFGGVVSGNVSTKSYTISGNETFALCPGTAFPTTYTIGKDCGTGVTIEFVAANGETGAFIGNVACST